jgi:hypothetical protein
VRQRAARWAAENILTATAGFIHSLFIVALLGGTIEEHATKSMAFIHLNRI